MSVNEMRMLAFPHFLAPPTWGFSKKSFIETQRVGWGGPAFSSFGRNVPRKLRLIGGAKGHNTNDNTLPGSAALPLPAGRQGQRASKLAPLCRGLS
jgi:hypothetical protein